MNIQSQNPQESIWGIHIHQELPLDEFKKSLVIQEACKQFLRQHQVAIDFEDRISPGYGPHLQYLWELRIENQADGILETLGLALSFMAINNHKMSAYIHPLRHNPTIDDDLLTEGLLNQGNTLWIYKKVDQKQDFFFNPPRHQDGNVIDTRSERLITEQTYQQYLQEGQQLFANNSFKDPYETIVNGFHIHLDYRDEQHALAMAIFEAFNRYLNDINMPPSSTRIYPARVNGPHIDRGWEVKFETSDPSIIKNIGYAIAWLMCNRHDLPVFIHPVTWQPGDHEEEYKAHEQYAMFMGELPQLDLNFFKPESSEKVSA